MDTRPPVARRALLSGASAAAIGVTSLRLPAAASAASTGGQGLTGFTIRSTTTYTQASAPDTYLFRSFTYGTNRYFCDLVNGQLIVFNASGTLIETVAIPDAATLLVGFDDPYNFGSSTLSADQLTSFVLVGNAAHVAYLVTGGPTEYLRVVRLVLTVAEGATTVATSSKDFDLTTAFAARIPTLEAGDYADLSLDSLSAPVPASTTALHCLLHSRVNFYDDSAASDTWTPYLDRIVIPIGAAWNTAISSTPIAIGDEYFIFSSTGAVAIPPTSPTHGLYFDVGTGLGVLVPLTGSPTRTLLSFDQDDLPETITSWMPADGTDVPLHVDGSTLYVAAYVTASGSGAARSAVLAFDVSTVPTTTLTATAAAVVPDLGDGAAVLTGDGTDLYLAIQYGFNFSTPGSPGHRSDGWVAKIQTGPLAWVATATVGLTDSPPSHFPMTLQSITTGVLSGGVGTTALDGRGAATAPLIVLVADAS